jgi:hypothetical protein
MMRNTFFLFPACQSGSKFEGLNSIQCWRGCGKVVTMHRATILSLFVKDHWAIAVKF